MTSAEDPQAARSSRRWRPLGARFALIALFLALMVWRLDIEGALRRLTDIDLRLAAAGLVVFTASKLVHAYRWRLFLAEQHRPPLAPLTGIFLLSNLANAVIPLRTGDLLRVELPNRRFGIPRAELASSVFIVESVLDGVAFVTIFLVTLPFLELPPIWRPIFFIAGGIIVTAFVASVVLARTSLTRDYANTRPIRWLAPRPRAFLGRVIPEFIEGMAVLGHRGSIAQAIGVSLIAWAFEVAVYLLMARAFGISLTPAEAVVVMIAANLIVSLPLTPWDFGPYELLVAETMVLLGAGRAEASGFAIGSHLLLQVWIALTGLAAMWLLGLRPTELLPRRHPDEDS